MEQKTLQGKLQGYFKGRQKKKELDLPLKMLRDGCGDSHLIDLIDFFGGDIKMSEDISYYTFSNIKRYYCTFEKNVKLYKEYGINDVSKIYHYVMFHNNEKFFLPFDYFEFFKTNETEKIWSTEIFPKIKIGEIYKTISPICYLTSNFNDLMVQGVQGIVWCDEIPEGSVVIPYQVINIEHLYFSKVMYNGFLYWCFGVFAPDDFFEKYNPHHI
ncbi:MAG: hypothetical protein AABY22_05590 [Nanoarchaeota archaeon]